MSFDELGLDERLLKTIARSGYSTPTPIQLQAIPVILKGGDVMGGARTGTGKTAAFALPILHNLSKRRAMDNRPRALVLTPTRELAAQVNESMITYGKNLKLYSTAIFGGVGINPQISELRKGVDILVATPGRLLDHLGQGTLDLSAIEILVLDEADRMLDMGFIHDIRKVLDILPEKRQNLLFSATYSHSIKKLADTFLRNPALIEVAPRNTAAPDVDLVVHPVSLKSKSSLLAKLIEDGDWNKALVFTRTKHGANRLVTSLERNNISAAAIHGNKSQTARTKALAEFKQDKINILVATDIAARGIDIDQLPCVVNFDLPNVAEDYIHRIGRTGRAGKSGIAISLVSADEQKLLFPIEKLLGTKIPVKFIKGFDQNPEDIHEETFVDFHKKRSGGFGRSGGRSGSGSRGGPRGSNGGSNGGGSNGGSSNSSRGGSAGSFRGPGRSKSRAAS
ncbi:MAG: DEAD/DEAH box helicase [Deltaproteobacteria bacterium]|nr:DEAD/DEAH box helicase [Deltaproteobacteria bacterium]